MNKSTIFRYLASSLMSFGLLISPMVTIDALGDTQISIDPYNDSGFDNNSVSSPLINNTPPLVTNSPQLSPRNKTNNIQEVLINGHPAPSRPKGVSGNVIKSNQILPQIPPLSEPYQAPNNPMVMGEGIIEERNNPPSSLSSFSPFDQTPPVNEPINNSNAGGVRSIDLSPNSISSGNYRVITPTVSPANSPSVTTQTNPPSMTSPNNLPKRRSLNDILILSNSGANSLNSAPTHSSTVNKGMYKVLVAANNPHQESLVKSLYPEAFRTVVKGHTMLQVGVFSTVNKADDVARSLQSRGLRTEITN